MHKDGKGQRAAGAKSGRRGNGKAGVTAKKGAGARAAGAHSSVDPPRRARKMGGGKPEHRTI